MFLLYANNTDPGPASASTQIDSLKVISVKLAKWNASQVFPTKIRRHEPPHVLILTFPLRVIK